MVKKLMILLEIISKFVKGPLEGVQAIKLVVLVSFQNVIFARSEVLDYSYLNNHKLNDFFSENSTTKLDRIVKSANLQLSFCRGYQLKTML